MKNSDILSKFQSLLNCSDPIEKKQNRDLFKSIVNDVAVVKELEDGKYVVLKKKYQHLLSHLSVENDESAKQLTEQTSKDAAETDKVQEHETLFQDGVNVFNRKETEPSTDSHNDGNTSPCHTGEHSTIHLALERTRAVDIKPKKAFSFVLSQVMNLNEHSGEEFFPVQTATANTHKPCALPLRLPASQTTKSPSIKFTEDSSSHKGGSVRNERPSVDSEGMVLNSVLLRRGCKNVRPSEEPKHSVLVPLEQAEHDWLVKLAAGQWDLVYALLLKDAHLAEKRDFMSGFTALHWATKCGNSKMVSKIIEVSRKFGNGINVNTKSHGGYTPLHIAAIHHQEYIITQLVEYYGADIRVRDNCGKRPYHYLHKGVRDEVRELLGEPKIRRQVGLVVPVKEEGESTLHKGHTLTLTRLFHQPPTISLFHQPPTSGHLKLRPRHKEMSSVTEEPLEV